MAGDGPSAGDRGAGAEVTAPAPARRDDPPVGSAVAAALGLPALFVVVYWGAARLAALQGQALRLTLPWDGHIPFVPWMVVPYLSLDLLFLAAVFLSESGAALRALVRRLVFVMLVAGICFALVPTEVGIDRPDVPGIVGQVFGVMAALDVPYNAVPSLHAAIGIVLWAQLSRHARRAVRWAVHGWFVLVIASTVLTWQHHSIDVAAGLALGLLGLWCCRRRQVKLLTTSLLAQKQQERAGAKEP